MSAISIPKGAVQLAGLVWKPKAESSGKTPALIVVHPGGGVKEQTASLYASKLADQGFLTLTYDAAYQGESGGEPHFLEDPNSRVSDVFAAIDYLETLDLVDTNKIGVVGICAGGGYAVAAAKADYRLKSVATVSMVNIGDSARRGWFGDEPPSKHVDSLKFAAQQMEAEAKGGEPAAAPYVPAELDDKTPNDMREAHDYYLTPRCQHPRAANKMLVRSLPFVLNFDAFYLADIYLKQPILMVVGEKAESKWHTDRLDKVIGGATKMITVPNAGHMDFYDKTQYVDPAVENVSAFMKEKLI